MKTNRSFMFTLIVFVVALVAGAISFAPTPSFAQEASACDVDVITETDITRQAENTPPTDEWVLYTRAATPGTGAFEVGPGQPPLGVGSLNLQTLGGSDKVFLFNFEHVGTKLADINKLSYSTYRTTGSGNQLPALNMVIDFNGPEIDGGFSTLVFEPVYNLDQQAVMNDTWQSWDAFGNGVWWSTRLINGQCAGATSTCDKTWSEIVANNPDATILGGYGVNQGSGNAGLNANVDALSIGYGTGDDASCVTYNFDPYQVAATAADCKNGGYTGVARDDGTTFKNQGQCVQYVNTGK